MPRKKKSSVSSKKNLEKTLRKVRHKMSDRLMADEYGYKKRDKRYSAAQKDLNNASKALKDYKKDVHSRPELPYNHPDRAVIAGNFDYLESDKEDTRKAFQRESDRVRQPARVAARKQRANRVRAKTSGRSMRTKTATPMVKGRANASRSPSMSKIMKDKKY